MIAFDGGDEVDVRAIGREALDVDLNAEAFDGDLARELLHDAGRDAGFVVGGEIDPEALAMLAGIEAAGLELAECHATGAAARSEDDRLDGDEVEQLGLARGGRED